MKKLSVVLAALFILVGCGAETVAMLPSPIPPSAVSVSSLSAKDKDYIAYVCGINAKDRFSAIEPIKNFDISELNKRTSITMFLQKSAYQIEVQSKFILRTLNRFTPYSCIAENHAGQWLVTDIELGTIHD